MVIRKTQILFTPKTYFLPDILWHYEYYPLINHLNSSKLKKDHLEYYHEHIFVINIGFSLCIKKEKKNLFFP